ncbi:MAG: FAD-dependent oxidoreductase [Bacillota bacterium]
MLSRELMTGVVNVEPTLVNKTGSWRYLTPVHQEISAPCHIVCPLGGEITQWVGLMGNDNEAEAYELITRKNALPAVTGRVCYHPCEGECNRGHLDATVSIRYLERALGDWGLRNYHPCCQVKENLPKVAVIGSGPAGLNCAYQLARDGFPVTIFEARPEPGGMLAWAIPSYRLPRDVLRAEIEFIKATGVEIKTSQTIGEYEYAELRKEFAAIFVATGAPKGVPLVLEGTGKKGVYDAVDFLARLAGGNAVQVGKSVIVIGGGNVAMDSARTALRLGATSVKVLYRRGRQEMPAHPEEVTDAEAEGVEIVFQYAPLSILGEDMVTGIKAVQTRASTGRQSEPELIPGSEVQLPAEAVIIAVGQKGDVAFIGRSGLLIDSGRGTINLCPGGDSKHPGLFAGGDVSRGPSTVAKALADGYDAAQAIGSYLTGRKIESQETHHQNLVVTYDRLNPAYFSRRLSYSLPGHKVPKKALFLNFAEVDAGLTPAEVIAEAGHCLSCGRCNQCSNCWGFCPDVAVEHGGDYKILLEYCKGCGICASECPRGVITMEASL